MTAEYTCSIPAAIKPGAVPTQDAIVQVNYLAVAPGYLADINIENLYTLSAAIIMQISCVEWKCMGVLSSRLWETSHRSLSGPAMGST